jgi:L-glutamine-phosphate cytidylyltransferase
MRAVILAAGRGSRLGLLGDEQPKCLVELAKKPLIERQVAALRGGGVTAIAVVRGYRADMISLPNITYFYNPRWAETNMVMSLAAAATWVRSEPIIISYADIFYRRELIRDLAMAAGDLVVVYDRAWRDLWNRRFVDPLSDAETFRTNESGKLIEIGGKTANIEEIAGQYIGLLKFTPKAWQTIDSLLVGLDPDTRDRLDMTQLLRTLLDQGFPISTHGTEGQWGEIDSPSDLALYESMANKGELVLEE